MAKTQVKVKVSGLPSVRLLIAAVGAYLNDANDETLCELREAFAPFGSVAPAVAKAPEPSGSDFGWWMSLEGGDR